MSFRIQLIGKFSLTRGNEPVPTRSYAKIYALLALRMEAGIGRKELIQCLWPDLDLKTASNRLRVALSTIRRELGSAFVEDEFRIGLNCNLVDIDYHAFLRMLSHLQDEVDEREELRNLESYVDVVERLLLPEIDEEWAHVGRAAWSGVALETVRRICQLAVKLDDHRLVVRAIEAGFVHDPYDDELWRQYLESSGLLGEKVKALALFSQARRTYIDLLGGDFDRLTLDFVVRLRDSPFSFSAKGETPLTPKEIELYARVVAAVLKDEPDTARALFGARCSYFEEANVSSVSIPLLTKLSMETSDRSLGWQKCTLNLLSLYANHGDLEQILFLGQEILDVSDDAVVRGTTLAYLSFVYLTKTDYSRALATVEECIAILVEAGHRNEAIVFYLNKASALIALGRYEEAAQLSQEGIDFFVPLGHAIADIQTCGYRHTLAFCLVLMERFDEAYEEARQVVDTMLARQYEPDYGHMLSFASYVVYMVARNPSAADTAILSLKAAYRTGNIISQIRALEYISGIIQKAGFGAEAKELLEYADRWRVESDTPRQSGHQVIVNRILAACGDVPAKRTLQDPTPRGSLTQAILLLRNIH